MPSTKPRKRGLIGSIIESFRAIWALLAAAWGVLSILSSLLPRGHDAGKAGKPPERTEEIDEPLSPERRKFLASITIAAGAGIGAVAGFPAIVFLLAPLTRDEPASFREVGAVGLFPIGTTTKVVLSDPSALPWAGVAGEQGAYLRHNQDDSFTAFAINCTHLGCPVHWLPDAKLFMCPCHGGVFYDDGSVATAPPEEPLAQHNVRVVNGQVEIETRAVKITGNILRGISD